MPLGVRRFCEGRRELRAGADAELAVGAGGGALSTVFGVTKSAWAISRLVGPSAAHLGDSAFARGQRQRRRWATRRGRAPVARTLGLGAGDERRGHAESGELDRMAKVLARLRALVRAAKGRAELVRAFALFELGGRVTSTSTASSSSASPCRRPRRRRRRAALRERARGAPGTGEVELLDCEAAGFLAVPELEVGERQAVERQGVKAGLLPRGGSKRRPAASVLSSPPARSPCSMRKRARRSRNTSGCTVPGGASPNPPRLGAASASSSLPCSISAWPEMRSAGGMPPTSPRCRKRAAPRGPRPRLRPDRLGTGTPRRDASAPRRRR